MKKRVLAALLALLMVACLLPATALAKDDEPENETELKNALNEAFSGDTVTLPGSGLLCTNEALFVAPGVTLTGGTLTLSGGANIDNRGTVACDVSVSSSGASVYNKGTVSGNVAVIGNAIVENYGTVSGNVTVTGDAKFTHQDGTVSGDVTVTGGSFQMGAYSIFTPTFTGSANISGGEFHYGQDLTVAANKTITVSGTGDFHCRDSTLDPKVTLSPGASIVNNKASGTVSFTLADGTTVTLYPGESYSNGALLYMKQGETRVCRGAALVLTSTTEMTAGWYTVYGSVININRIVVTGDVHLILTDGCTLTVSEGIELTDGNSLTVYAQRGGSGKLNAGRDNLEHAGIGGSAGGAHDISVLPGGDCGALTVYGGALTVKSRNASVGGGIGKRYSSGLGDGDASGKGGRGGTLRMYGGTLIATSAYGAGIGGGESADGDGGDGGTLTVYGGTLIAAGAHAGVGGGTGIDIGSYGAAAVVTVSPSAGKAISVEVGSSVDGGGKAEITGSPFAAETVVSGPVDGKKYAAFAEGDAPVPGGSAPTVSEPTGAKDVPVTVGSAATLTVRAQNAAAYQWYIDRGHGYSRIDGATNASYTTAAVTLQNDGYRYYCAVSNDSGSVDSPVFTLRVTETPVIPETGDGSLPLLWTGLALLAGVGLIASRRKRRA